MSTPQGEAPPPGSSAPATSTATPAAAEPRGFAAAVRREVKAFLGQLDALPVIVFITAGLALFFYEYYGSTHFFEEVLVPHFHIRTTIAEPGEYFYWYGSAFVLLLLFPQLVVRGSARALKKPDAVPTLGWGLGDWKVGLSACAIFYGVMLVILCVVVWTSDFQGKYPLFEDADRSVRMFVSYELAYALYFVAWEYFFRGFLTFSLEKTLGIWVVFVQMLPFVCEHFGKPDLEALSSIFGGIALGYLAIRTRSFWYGVFIHAATAVSLDCLVVAVKHLR